ncbi:Dabb family protein [Ferroacidibacillus organovorans]|uniref:Stress-response A/B barrel domain-containing protein n=1 Tax=Ferroacidibacillus organovorans TaxID=1765683 RepID=A0A162UTG1_9BACL|nr:Dabb family protein [Ferroacidibacillus organovorans]KYP82029.1 hypothetical protein AYJ22_04830 [Ferroacidibacillus organovorans]OAG94349.1 hypothetical protein AYW79_05650 [Ferroacidibacillus organovorans]OPG15253.1 hypothetical protein B2M26_12345 [Ferroacidibacillus organovorans]
MIEHIVLLAWKEGTPHAEQERLLRELLALKEQIPGIVSVSGGENFSARSQGYHHGFLVTFKDRASLDAYGPHKAHQRVVAQLQPVLQSILVLDFERATE